MAHGVDRQSWEYQTGIVAELKVATRLMQDGCLVSLVRHGSDVAPALRGWNRNVTLPDLQVWWPRTRQQSWVEVKWKSTCGVVHAMDDLRTTGIDLGKLAAYETVERVTGYPVVLVFVHEAQDAVVLAGLHSHRVPSLGVGGTMAFWAFDRLKRVCSYRDLMQARPRDQRLDEPLFAPPEAPPTQLSLLDLLEGTR